MTRKSGEHAVSWRDQEGEEEEAAEDDDDRGAGGEIGPVSEEEGAAGAEGAKETAAPEEERSAIGEKGEGGGGSDQEPDAEDAAYGLKGGDESQDEQAEEEVVHATHRNALGSGDVGFEKSEKEGTEENVRGQQDHATDAKGEPEIGGADGHDVSEEPVLEFPEVSEAF